MKQEDWDWLVALEMADRLRLRAVPEWPRARLDTAAVRGSRHSQRYVVSTEMAQDLTDHDFASLVERMMVACGEMTQQFDRPTDAATRPLLVTCPMCLALPDSPCRPTHDGERSSSRWFHPGRMLDNVDGEYLSDVGMRNALAIAHRTIRDGAIGEARVMAQAIVTASRPVTVRMDPAAASVLHGMSLRSVHRWIEALGETVDARASLEACRAHLTRCLATHDLELRGAGLAIVESAVQAFVGSRRVALPPTHIVGALALRAWREVDNVSHATRRTSDIVSDMLALMNRFYTDMYPVHRPTLQRAEDETVDRVVAQVRVRGPHLENVPDDEVRETSLAALSYRSRGDARESMQQLVTRISDDVISLLNQRYRYGELRPNPLPQRMTLSPAGPVPRCHNTRGRGTRMDQCVLPAGHVRACLFDPEPDDERCGAMEATRNSTRRCTLPAAHAGRHRYEEI